MNTYCTPTLYNERLGNGDRIPIILYELNPARDPKNRVNYYRNNFNSKDKLNKTMPYYLNQKKKNRKTKSAKITKSVLYNSFYSNVLRINFERPREIINEDGVIISRHFKSLNVNSREYPKSMIKIISFKQKSGNKGISMYNPIKKNHNYNGNFFSTEIKYYSNKSNKNAKNINLKNQNKAINYNYNNIFSKSFYNTKTNNNITTNKSKYKITSYENTKTNHIISPKYVNYPDNFDSKLPLLLFNSK